MIEVTLLGMVESFCSFLLALAGATLGAELAFKKGGIKAYANPGGIKLPQAEAYALFGAMLGFSLSVVPFLLISG